MVLAKSVELRVGRWLEKITRTVAYGGGFVLALIALVTVASIIGRFFLFAGLGPIKGDYEIVEMGSAIAIFAFMPFAQFKRGHVVVDIFTSRLSERFQTFLGFAGDSLIALASGVLVWRFWLGLGEKIPYGSDIFRSALSMGYKPFFVETTYELSVPIWIPYALAFIGAALFFVVSLFTMWRSLNWTLEGREYQP
ncbi:TRAP transporter small permease [Profundibacter sp.]